MLLFFITMSSLGDFSSHGCFQLKLGRSLEMRLCKLKKIFCWEKAFRLMFKYSAVFRWRNGSARLAHTQINTQKRKAPPLIPWKPRHMTRGHWEKWSRGHQSRSNLYVVFVVFYPNLRAKELTEDEDSVHSTTCDHVPVPRKAWSTSP